MARSTELRAVESLLRWRYRKEGKDLPDHENLRTISRTVTDQAHRIIGKRGKSIWQGFEKAWKESKDREDDNC